MEVALFHKLLGAALVAVVSAHPAVGETVRPDESEIVVQGIRDRDSEIQRFVGALTEAPVRGQIARFDWAVCPAVSGFDPTQNVAIADRMRTVARAAGIKLAEPGCKPNAIVIATSDKKVMLDWLRREAPAFFRDPLGQRIRISDQDGPTIAWQVEGRLDADGRAVGVNNSAGDSGTASHYSLDVTRAPSRITAATRPHFLASLLIIELGSLAGLTTTQVADYAAMRVFARTEPDRLSRTSAPTILNILGSDMGDEVPMSLTRWDLGFLRALYGSAENHYAAQQRGEIQRRLERELDEARRGETRGE